MTKQKICWTLYHGIALPFPQCRLMKHPSQGRIPTVHHVFASWDVGYGSQDLGIEGRLGTTLELRNRNDGCHPRAHQTKRCLNKCGPVGIIVESRCNVK